jgi:uncharacterized protein (DUF2249 family)
MTANSRRTWLDVRSVEPKHRLERILSAWSELRPGDELMLTVDHDPKCMYYTLAADYGPESFRFEYLENGPVDWRVRVERR